MVIREAMNGFENRPKYLRCQAWYVDVPSHLYLEKKIVHQQGRRIQLTGNSSVVSPSPDIKRGSIVKTQALVVDLKGEGRDVLARSDLLDVFTPIDLPCGRKISNRLVKAAMYEHLSRYFGGPPTSRHVDLYAHWAAGEWGMVITGNVQVAADHLTLGADMVVPAVLTPQSCEPFRELSSCITGVNPRQCAMELMNTIADGTIGSKCQKRVDEHDVQATMAIMQLNHPGRQAATFLGGRLPFCPPLGPSRTRVGARANEGLVAKLLYRLLFQTAKDMSMDEIDEVVNGFVRGSRLAVQSGFDGVQLHASHGYLLAQFMSPKTNRREDAYANPLHLLHRIVTEIRSKVPSTFVLGIKLNAADYVAGDTSEAEALGHIEQIAGWGGVDFIEVSGGDYECPEFMTKPSASKLLSTRQAFFSRFSRRARETLHCHDDSPTHPSSSYARPLIMLTGGLRTDFQLASALRQGHADLLGLGRPAVLVPNLPAVLKKGLEEEGRMIIAESMGWTRDNGTSMPSSPPKSEESSLSLPPCGILQRVLSGDPSPDTPSWFPNLVGASVSMAWYVLAMRRLALHPCSHEPNIYTRPKSDNIWINDSHEDWASAKFDRIGCGLGLRLRPIVVVVEMYLGVAVESTALLLFLAGLMLALVLLSVLQ